MDFFTRQDEARKQTKWLVLYFAVGIALTVLAIYGLAAALLLNHKAQQENPGAPFQIWNSELFGGIALVTLGIIAVGSLYKISQLSSGGSAVAVSLGGRPLDPQTRDLNEQKLRNIVEEMAIASGVPVPELYILDREPGINAFAAGRNPDDAVIGVTRGAIDQLNRDELQGVIGHEFSHILNGDMRLNLRLMGWIFGILCLTVVGRILVRSVRGGNSDRKKASVPIAVIGLGLIGIGGIGVFFGKLIKAAVSRQREFLADASAVQFTRNPSGLAGALKKIGGLASGSRLSSPGAEEASHMFFGNGLRASWFQVFATHPPLAERIKLLEPAFDGTFPAVTRAKPPAPPIIAGGTPPISRLAETTSALSAPEALQAIGAPQAAHLQFAHDAMESLPATLILQLREPFSATALVYALLLSPRDEVRQQQLAGLKGANAAAVAREAAKILPEVKALNERLKLPVVELAMPALRQLSPRQYFEFIGDIQSLIEADAEIDLFEYALQKALRRHLEPSFAPPRRSIVQYYALRAVPGECALLLSALAHAGHNDAAAVCKAFTAGIAPLQLAPNDARLLPLDECTLSGLDAALARLAQTAPQCKKRLLQACALTVSFDGILHTQEAELLRAIADTLDCPMPPFVETRAFSL